MFCRVSSSTTELVQRARSLLEEGRSVLAARAPDERDAVAGTDDLLDLYDRLRGRLAAIADDEVGELLAEISETLDRLSSFADDLDRVHGLRRALAKPRG
jgi:hypothetical protein